MSSRLQKKAAVHAFENKAEAMLAPLLEGDEDSVSSDESSQYTSSSTSTISVHVKQTATEMLKTAGVSIALLLGGVISAGAMVVAPHTAVFIMAGFCIAHAPYSGYKEFQIMKLPALRSLNNALRHDANKLEDAVEYLSQQIDKLQPEADRAAEEEEKLRVIADAQNYNVDKLVGLVQENEAILHQMRDNLRERIIQDIFKIVMTSDKNNDGRFCKVETKMLVLKISLALQEYGVEFDEAKFYRVMSADPSVTQTLSIVKRLIPDMTEDDTGGDGSGEEDSVDSEAYNMFHMRANSNFSNTSQSGRRMSLSVVKPPRKSALDEVNIDATVVRAAASISAARKTRQVPDPPQARAPADGTPSRTRRRKRDVIKNLFADPAHHLSKGAHHSKGSF